MGRCPTSTHKHCLGTRGEEAKTQLEAATGQEVPLHQQQIKDQTKQALVTEKKKNKKEILDNYRTALFQTLGRKWSRTSLTLFPEHRGQKHLCKWQEKFPTGKMCQIDPVTYDEATGSVDEGSAADTIYPTLADKKAQTRLKKKWLV